MLTRTIAALFAGCVLTIPAYADAFTDTIDAGKASAILASVTVCKTPISDVSRRILYTVLLNKWHTLSMVAFVVDQEISSLNEMSTSDRTAMCLALGPQNLAERPTAPAASFRVVTDFNQAACGEGEIMVSAYCAGGAALRIDGTTGAACDGGAKAVLVCARQSPEDANRP
jgi:hypothetical protein